MGLRLCALAAVILATPAICAPPAGAQSETRPWAYISPFYQPKTGTNANLHFTNGSDATANVNLRRYDAIGGLLSSTNLNVSPKGTIIAFAGANNGAQMHIEAWVNTPALLVEIFFTDAANETHRIDSSRWRIVGPELAVPAAVAGLQQTMGELRPPILALGGQFETVGGKVDAVQSGVSGLDGRFDSVGGKLDALQSSVSGLGGPVNGVTPQIQALAAENEALRQEVRRVRSDLRALRKLILKRLPRRSARRR